MKRKILIAVGALLILAGGAGAAQLATTQTITDTITVPYTIGDQTGAVVVSKQIIVPVETVTVTQTVTVTETTATTPPPPPSTASVWVSPTGNDSSCTRGNESLPCRTFNRAYQIAKLGDVVQVAGGTYPRQTILQEASKDSTGDLPDVVFQPAAGATVRVAGVDLGTQCYGLDPSCYTGPDHLTIKNMTDSRSPQGPWNVYHESNDVTLENIDASNFYAVGVRDFRVLGGDWGPCSYGAQGCLNNKIDMDPAYRNERVLIEGGTYHDIRINTQGQHLECMFLVGGIDITVRGNKFYGCEFFDLFVQYYGDLNFPRLTYNPFRGLLIENNWFAQPYDGSGNLRDTAVHFDDGWQYGWENVLVRFNSAFRSYIDVCGDGIGSDPCLNVNRVGGGTHSVTFTNVRVVGNITNSSSACYTGVTYERNVRIGGNLCGTDLAASAYPYTNGVSGAALNYHLTGGPAVDALTGGGDQAIANDIDGQIRTAPRDAGSDER